MSMFVYTVGSFDDLISRINGFSNNPHLIFRGQLDYNWPLQTSLQRHNPLRGKGDPKFNDKINKFVAGVSKTSDLPYPIENKLQWMEYGQHHGLPTPCMDFSYSPYVGLFFAFDGLTKAQKGNAALFVVDFSNLASYYAKVKSGAAPSASALAELRNTFLAPANISSVPIPDASGVNILPFFDNRNLFPFDKLQFFPHPDHSNMRMIRQQGCFIYDTLDYKPHYMVRSLEEFCNMVPVADEAGIPTLQKFLIPHSMAKDVFSALDVMNINASLLYLDHSGAARDVKNSYFYNPRSMHVL